MDRPAGGAVTAIDVVATGPAECDVVAVIAVDMVDADAIGVRDTHDHPREPAVELDPAAVADEDIISDRPDVGQRARLGRDVATDPVVAGAAEDYVIAGTTVDGVVAVGPVAVGVVHVDVGDHEVHSLSQAVLYE